MPAICCPNCETSQQRAGAGVCYNCGEDLVVLNEQADQDGIRRWLNNARLEPIDTACCSDQGRLGQYPLHYDVIDGGDHIRLRRADGQDEHVEGLIGSIHTDRPLDQLRNLRGQALSDRVYELNKTKSSIIRQETTFGTPDEQAKRQQTSILKTLRVMAVKREDYERALNLHERIKQRADG